MAQLKNTVVNGSLKVNGRAETDSLITNDIKKTNGTSYVGNGILTIKQGSQSYTFSANQDNDQTITLESFNTDTHNTSHGTDIEKNFHSQLYLGSFNSAMKKVTKTGVVNYGLNPQFFSSMLVRLNASSNDALSNLRDCISSLYSYLDGNKNNTYLTSHIGLLSIPSRTLEDASGGLFSLSQIENNSRPWIYSVIRNGDTNKPTSFILFTDFIKTYIMNISDSTISRIAVDADTLGGKTSANFALSTHTHNYLPLTGGTLSGNLKLSTNNKIATSSDANLLSYTSNDQVNIGYTAFDLKLQSNHKPVWYKFDGTTEDILTAGDWVQNTATADGYVLKGGGSPNQAWMTDENGNPGWRTVATTNTWRPIEHVKDGDMLVFNQSDFKMQSVVNQTIIRVNDSKFLTITEAKQTYLGKTEKAESAKKADDATKFNGWLIDYDNGEVDKQWICAFDPENANGRTIRAMDSNKFARKLTEKGNAMTPVYIDANGQPATTRPFTGLVEASVANNVLTLTILE